MPTDSHEEKKFVAYGSRDLDRLPQLKSLGTERLEQMKAVAAVLPFRVNNYVVENLIDWNAVPHDPVFQLTFPQPGMLRDDDLAEMTDAVRRGEDPKQLAERARPIQMRLNPHPAGQLKLNVPKVDGREVSGIQHKYRETVLFFPNQGQTCHAYCSYCFRWAQFIGIESLKMAGREAGDLADYVAQDERIESVLITGGDPLIMRTKLLERYIEPLLGIEHLRSIRLGTKSPAYWPYRFTTDRDSDDLLRLFERVRASGKHLALMAHYSHPRELSTNVAKEAVSRIQSAGAIVRCQAPLIRHVNDDAATWRDLWTEQVRLGAVPYYMFVERDTGSQHYFEVPLARAVQVFQDAYRQLSGLGRTVRGPSMSATPGKVLINGVTVLAGERVFALSFIQARDPSWVGRPFYAKYDRRAVWLDDLRPAFGESEFFFESEKARTSAARPGVWPPRAHRRRWMIEDDSAMQGEA